MTQYPGLELQTDENSPFVGVRPGIVASILQLNREIHDWHERIEFRAVYGQLEDHDSALRLFLSAEEDKHLRAMLPHGHDQGVLLLGLEVRQGPTVVCSGPKNARIYSNFELNDFRTVMELQKEVLAEERCFEQTWPGPIENGENVIVPFLYIFPGTRHFKKIEDGGQYETSSTLRGCAFDAAGNTLG